MKEKYDKIDTDKKNTAADFLVKFAKSERERNKFRAIMEALKPAIIQKQFQEKQVQRQASSLQIQTAYRNRGARQEFERQRLLGVPPNANPALYPLLRGAGTPLGDISVVSEEDFSAWLDTFGP